MSVGSQLRSRLDPKRFAGTRAVMRAEEKNPQG